MQDAIDIVKPMTRDSVDFVRQGAFIALCMILVDGICEGDFRQTRDVLGQGFIEGEMPQSVSRAAPGVPIPMPFVVGGPS